MPVDLSIRLCDEELVLLPERAVFWPRTATLLVADAHWGKAATFRAAGIALPGGTTGDDLARLDAALARTAARRLVLLGDLIHAKAGRAEATFAAVEAWRTRHTALAVTLVRGNHDQHAGDPPEAWRIDVLDAPVVERPFVLQHHPTPHPDGYVLAGHLHPAVNLRGIGRLPCFWFGARVGVLPAWTSFAGMANVAAKPDDRVYVAADDEVVGPL